MNSNKEKIILGMGNAVLDIFFSSNELEIEKLGLTKGQMTIVDQKKSDETIKSLIPLKKSSGGSVANSIAGIGILGGNPSFCGRVSDDSVGNYFIKDIEKSGVKFLCSPKNEGLPTAKCLVFVTSEGERTMQTCLGASIQLNDDDIYEEYFKDASILFIEGYLWSSDSARKAISKAIKIAKKRGIKIAFSLSDSGLVRMFRNEFKKLITESIDILIGNYEEYSALFESNEIESLSLKVHKSIETGVMTDGANGAILFSDNLHETFSAIPNTKVLDSTGAGDMFAAGFLFKLNQNDELGSCVKFGCEVASKILSHYGARPVKEML